MRPKEKSILQAKPLLITEVQGVTKQEKVHAFLQKIQEKVLDLIDASAIKVSNKKIPFSEVRKKQPQHILQKLKKVQQNRQKIQSKLQYMLNEEKQLKIEHKKNQYAQNIDGKQSRLSAYHSRQKSQLSQQDITILKKLKKQQKEFQHSLSLKTKAHQQMIQSFRKQTQQLKEKQRKQVSQARRAEIVKRMETIQMQKVQRQKQYEQQKLKLIQIKTKKKLFEEMDKSQKQKQKQQIEKKVLLMQQRIRDQKMQLMTIKQHQQKYNQIKIQRRLERQRKKQQFQQMAKERRSQLDCYQKSKYHTITVNQTKRQREQQMQKQRQKADLIEAAKQYAELVKRDHSPRVKTKSSSEESQQKVEKLTFQEVKEMGNKYMEHMKSFLRKRKGNNSKLSNQSFQEDKKLQKSNRSASTKYKDYLSQIRKVKGDLDNKMSKTNDSRIRDRSIRRDIEEVHKIMSSGQGREDKLQRIKNIALKLQVQKGDDHNMLDKISAKLKILQTLANN